jgi:hypothetical protein
MNWEDEGKVRLECVVFYKVNEEWGGLSNMSNDFPLRVNGVRISSSEALYQLCRFPHSPSPDSLILYESDARPDSTS